MILREAMLLLDFDRICSVKIAHSAGTNTPGKSHLTEPAGRLKTFQKFIKFHTHGSLNGIGARRCACRERKNELLTL